MKKTKIFFGEKIESRYLSGVESGNKKSLWKSRKLPVRKKTLIFLSPSRQLLAGRIMKIDGISWHNNENRWRYKMSGVRVYVEARVTVGNIIEKEGRRFTVNRLMDRWMKGWYNTVLHYTALYFTILCILLSIHYYTILNCTTLHYTILYCTALYCTYVIRHDVL